MKCLASLGSNIGASKKNIETAICLISKKCFIEAESSLMLSSPVGELKQADFFNKIILFKTKLTPIKLLKFFKNIEYKIGRVKRDRWREREIDLDIICYEGLIESSAVLTIPHKELCNRLFVLMGASQIAPSYKVEGFNKTFLELYNLRKKELSFQRVSFLE